MLIELRGPQIRCFDQLKIWLSREKQPVAFLQGNSGLGKSCLARKLNIWSIDQGFIPIVKEINENEGVDDFLLALNQDLLLEDFSVLEDAKDKDQLNLYNLKALFKHKILLILDEYQYLLDSGEPRSDWRKLIAQLANQVGSGKLLLLTNQQLAGGKWRSAHRMLRLNNWDRAEAVAYFRALLRDHELAEKVDPNQDQILVSCLGDNPRAIKTLVGCLIEESLGQLIERVPQLCTPIDQPQDGTPADVERALLQNLLNQLPRESLRLLSHIAIFRGNVKHEVEGFFDTDSDCTVLRNELVRRFLVVPLDDAFYRVHPVARDLLFRGDYHGLLGTAHRQAVSYYSRHFKSRRAFQKPGPVGRNFVEASFHLLRCGQSAKIPLLAQHFESYLRALIKPSSPVPKQAGELDGRIDFLSALLQDGGPLGWEYHLARCLYQRGGSVDWEQALTHVRRACTSQAKVDTWVLRVKLEAKIEGIQPAFELVEFGMEQLAPDTRAPLYCAGATILDEGGRQDDAIALLVQGIKEIPPRQGLFSLYQSCSELMASRDRSQDAISLLEQGIQKVPPTHSLYTLYQGHARLLASSELEENAISSLLEGIANIPVNQNRHLLVQQAFLYFLGRDDKKGIQELLAKDFLSHQEIGFGRLCLLTAHQEWLALIHEAGRLTQSQRSLYLFQYEAFAQVCLGQGEAARDALARYDKLKPGLISWLQALIALCMGCPDDAQHHLEIYLRRALIAGEVIGLPILLRIWDESSGHLGPAYVHPLLPPSITGLPQTLFRSCGSGPVLPESIKTDLAEASPNNPDSG